MHKLPLCEALTIHTLIIFPVIQQYSNSMDYPGHHFQLKYVIEMR